MKKPAPKVGQIVKFDYLWRDEQMQGRTEGAKERPCAVVVALRLDENGDTSVLLAPITHAQPKPAQINLELPDRTRSLTGLDGARSWLVLSEVNLVKWSDAGLVPARKGQWLYGTLPRGMAMKAIALVKEGLLKRRAQIVDRQTGP
ncbi:MAG: hypothetical protein RLZZ157_1489 [Pseudomonadota bacterium]